MTAAGTLLVLAGETIDLAVPASVVARVIERREAGTAEPIDLFALSNAPCQSEPTAGRVVVLTFDDGRELLIAAPGTLSVISPPENAVLPLPRIVTRRAPWLDAVVLQEVDGVDRARPLLLVAADRIDRHRATIPNAAPLW
jgi:hypothetical protein